MGYIGTWMGTATNFDVGSIQSSAEHWIGNRLTKHKGFSGKAAKYLFISMRWGVVFFFVSLEAFCFLYFEALCFFCVCSKWLYFILTEKMKSEFETHIRQMNASEKYPKIKPPNNKTSGYLTSAKSSAIGGLCHFRIFISRSINFCVN